MSSSESKASYPATPLKNSDTSSVPTDLTVSSGENPKNPHDIKKFIDENKLLKIELRKKDSLIELLRTEYEERLRKAECMALEANNAKNIAEDSAKLRMELQNTEMSKIQKAISSQLQEVTNRQQNLELVNQKLREKADVAKAKLESFNFDPERYKELLEQEPKDMSIFEYAELIIYKNVHPEKSKTSRLETYNLELNDKLSGIARDIDRLQNTIQSQRQQNDALHFQIKIKEEEIYKIKETVRSMDQLNQTMENKIQEFEKSSKMLETNLIKKSNECDLYRKRCEDLTNEFKLYAKDNLSLNETLAGLRHEFSNIRLKFDGLEVRSEKGLSTLSTFTKQMQEKQLELLEELSTSIFQNNLDAKYREQYLSTIRELVTEQIRSQEYMTRLSAERNQMKSQVDQITAELNTNKVQLSENQLVLYKERERLTQLTKELETLKFDHIKKCSELDIVKEKLSYELSRQGDTKLDVKNSKEYQTLLKDLKLLLSHRDEIQDMRELIVKLQQD